MKTDFKPGTRFRGNVNGALFEVVKVEKHKSGQSVTLKEIKTGNLYTYGLKALEHCDITILEREAEDGK